MRVCEEVCVRTKTKKKKKGKGNKGRDEREAPIAFNEESTLTN